MRKQYLLAIANSVLIVIYLRFAHERFLRLNDIYLYYGKDPSLLDIITWMKHELLITMMAFLSLIGILFWRNNKIFFLLSTLYISTQLITVLLAPSFSLLFSVKVIAVIIFIWFLIYQNTYTVYTDKTRLKLIFLSISGFIYLIFLYSVGALKW